MEGRTGFEESRAPQLRYVGRTLHIYIYIYPYKSLHLSLSFFFFLLPSLFCYCATFELAVNSVPHAASPLCSHSVCC